MTAMAICGSSAGAKATNQAWGGVVPAPACAVPVLPHTLTCDSPRLLSAPKT